MDFDIKALEQRARAGDIEAQVALGHHYAGDGNARLARGCFANAARLGNLPALRSLAISLLTQEPVVAADGMKMIRSAADKGDAEAIYVCAMLAAQDDSFADRWNVAIEDLKRAASAGFELAQQQLDFLGTAFNPGDVTALTAARETRSQYGTPRIQIIENFVSPEICDWLIARARPRMGRAEVYDPATGGGRPAEARTNSSIPFDIAQSDLILLLLRDRIAATSGLPLASLEATAVLHYEPGQTFEPHFDFLDSKVPAYGRDIATHGQRVATFLLYLNDNYEGGETEFLQLDWRYKGRKGDALLFWNVDTAGLPNPKTQHAGLPPVSGEKWLLSQWLRQRPG